MKKKKTSLVDALLILIFGSVFACTAIMFGMEWSNVNSKKLDAIATIFGNAFGVMGAIFSVLLILNRDARNERELVGEIKKQIGLSIVAKFGMIDLLFDRSLEIKNMPNPDRSDFHKAYDEFRHITWNDFESLESLFHKVDVLLPYSFAQLKLRERKVIEAFEKVTNLPLDYFMPLRQQAELLHSCCDAYVQTVMLLSSRSEVEHEDWVYKKYPIRLN